MWVLMRESRCGSAWREKGLWSIKQRSEPPMIISEDFRPEKSQGEDECIKHQVESLGEQKGHGGRRKVGGLKRGACVGSLAPNLYRSIR